LPAAPEPPASPKFAALPAAPVLPKPVAPTGTPAAIEAVDPLPAPEPPADNPASGKRTGNRFFHALHKVFHKDSATGQAADSTPVSQPEQ